MSDQSPEFIVSDACISFTEALLSCRSSVVTVDEANAIGRELYTWFSDQGAINDDKACFAKRSIQLGIVTLEKNSVETIDETVTLIQETYAHYTNF